MSNPAPVSQPKKRRIGLKVGIVFGALLLLLVIFYFVATSSAFVRGVILPRVAKSLNSQITVRDASLSPFSSLVLHNLKLTPNGAETLLEAESVVARYKLMDILRGKMTVNEVTLVAPVIYMVEHPDGSRNWDPLTKKSGKEKEPASKKSSPKSEKPTQLDLHNISLKNGTLHKIVQHKDGTHQVTEVSNINIALDQLKNGGAGHFTVASDLRIDQGAKTESPSNLLQAKVSGAFSFTLMPDLMPKSVQGDSKLQVATATGTLADLAGLTGVLEADWTPAEIRTAGVRFERGGNTLGQLKVSGPFDVLKREGKLNLEIVSIDRQVLNLVGAGRGIDFTTTVFNGATAVGISKQASVISVDGKLTGAKVALKQGDKTTPPLDLVIAYAVNVDLSQKSALIQTLNLEGQASGSRLIDGKLDKPMTVKWGGTSTALPASTFQLSINQLKLEDWKVFLGDSLDRGLVNLQSTVQVLADGKLKLQTTAALQNFSGNLGGTALGQAALDAAITATYEAKDPQKNIAGLAEIKNFSGKYGEYLLQNFQSHIDYALEMNGDRLRISTLKGTLSQQNQPGGNFDVKGDWNKTAGTGEFNVALNGINQNTLGLAFAPMLKERKLISANLDGNATAKISKDASIKAQLKLANLVVRDPAKPADDPPLSVELKIDGTKKQNILDLALLQLNLSPTDRAKNQLDLKGQVNLAQPKAITGKVSLTADSMDLTPFYDLYSSTNQAKKKTRVARRTMPKDSGRATTTPAPPPSSDSNEEPEAMDLPFQQFNAEVKVGKLFLRDMNLANLRADTKINGSSISLSPFEVSVNEAPMRGNLDLNLGVRGYTYNLALSADRVPLEPLANTFIPDKRGQYKGSIVANVALKGAGITGTSMKKNLAGQINMTFTNANIQIVSPKLRRVLVPIAAILRVTDITQSPLNWMNTSTEIGGGNINLKALTIVSEAFQGDTHGVIPIADIFTNSPINKFPVNFQLRRSLAQKSNLLPADAPPDAKYVKLPDFVKLKGTVGKPDSDINEIALAGVLLKSGSGIVGGKAGGIIEGIGGILTGNPSPGARTNATADTNKPSQKANAVDVIGGILNSSRANKTNSPTETNPPSEKVNASDLLKGIFKKK